MDRIRLLSDLQGPLREHEHGVFMASGVDDIVRVAKGYAR
jgi:hypothetical protein